MTQMEKDMNRKNGHGNMNRGWTQMDTDNNQLPPIRVHLRPSTVLSPPRFCPPHGFSEVF